METTWFTMEITKSIKTNSLQILLPPICQTENQENSQQNTANIFKDSKTYFKTITVWKFPIICLKNQSFWAGKNLEIQNRIIFIIWKIKTKKSTQKSLRETKRTEKSNLSHNFTIKSIPSIAEKKKQQKTETYKNPNDSKRK